MFYAFAQLTEAATAYNSNSAQLLFSSSMFRTGIFHEEESITAVRVSVIIWRIYHFCIWHAFSVDDLHGALQSALLQ